MMTRLALAGLAFAACALRTGRQRGKSLPAALRGLPPDGWKRFEDRAVSALPHAGADRRGEGRTRLCRARAGRRQSDLSDADAAAVLQLRALAQWGGGDLQPTRPTKCAIRTWVDDIADMRRQDRRGT